jgi:ComF family protein
MPEQNYWRTIKQQALDLLFPPTRRCRFVRQLSPTEVADLPAAQTIDKEYVRAVFDYQHKTTRAIVQAAKYDGSEQAAQLMGQILYDELMSFCQKQRIFSQEIRLVPIPLAKNRYKQRGFNQSQRIAQAIESTARKPDHLLVQPALEKTRETKPQTQLSRADRKSNIKDCFQLRTDYNVKRKTLVLIDDVTTTGTTLKEAKKALQVGDPNHVLALAFAH